jgi:hypothetical protein
MQPSIRKLMIQTLKAQVDVCRLRCECLSTNFQTAPTFEQREILAQHWDDSLKTGYIAQLMLGLIARQDRRQQCRESDELPEAAWEGRLGIHYSQTPHPEPQSDRGAAASRKRGCCQDIHKRFDE